MAKQRQSFEESTKGGSGGSGGGGGGGKGNLIKIAVLVVALGAAGYLLASYFGIIGGKEPVQPRLEDSNDPEVQKALEASREINKKIEKINRPPSGS